MIVVRSPTGRAVREYLFAVTLPMPLLRRVLPLLALGVLTASSAGPALGQTPGPLTVTAADGVTLYGEPFFADLEPSAPLVLLFHQAGSNGRGEYADLAPWLNRLGFRVIAWDQRAGAERFGQTNRTAAGLPAGTPAGYCDAYADLEAALGYVIEHGLAEEAFVWGSSYSAALVFRLAAEHPDVVAGALAFSPAGGGPMAECLADPWLADIEDPVLALRPASEMANPSSRAQRSRLEAAGVDFHVVEHGVHGSSMLVDARTGRDMSADRAVVARWLQQIVGAD